MASRSDPRSLVANIRHHAWPAIGIAAVAFSSWLLYHEVRGLSLDDVVDSLNAISWPRWLLAAAATFCAYGALAWYDRIALLHLGKRLSWPFISLCSFTAYAIAHNIGASVLSGAVVRYRAYTSQGLTVAEVGVLVALCSFTFALGTIVLGGLVLLVDPDLVGRFLDLPDGIPIAASVAMLGFVLVYVAGACLKLRPLSIGRLKIYYPRLPIVARQLVAGPLELLGAAAIVYFALPDQGNPGFLIVLGIFLASFSVALLSHAPGGLGVLEVMFLTGLPEMDAADVLAALIVFRILYLLVPLAFSLIVILLFEHSQLARGLLTKAP